MDSYSTQPSLAPGWVASSSASLVQCHPLEPMHKEHALCRCCVIQAPAPRPSVRAVPFPSTLIGRPLEQPQRAQSRPTPSTLPVGDPTEAEWRSYGEMPPNLRPVLDQLKLVEVSGISSSANEVPIAIHNEATGRTVTIDRYHAIYRYGTKDKGRTPHSLPDSIRDSTLKTLATRTYLRYKWGGGVKPARTRLFVIASAIHKSIAGYLTAKELSILTEGLVRRELGGSTYASSQLGLKLVSPSRVGKRSSPGSLFEQSQPERQHGHASREMASPSQLSIWGSNTIQTGSTAQMAGLSIQTREANSFPPL